MAIINLNDVVLEYFICDSIITDAINTVENIENARKIQATVTKYTSTECKQFAEELLGYSLEIDLSGIDEGKYETIHNTLQRMTNTAMKMIKPLDDITKACDSDRQFEKKLVSIYARSIYSIRESAEKIRQSHKEFFNRNDVKQHDHIFSVIGDVYFGKHDGDIEGQVKMLKAVIRYSGILANTGKGDTFLKDASARAAMKDMLKLLRKTMAISIRMIREGNRMLKK